MMSNVCCKASDLKSGEWLSGTVYYKILGTSSTNNSSKDIITSYNEALNVENSILEKEMISASQFDVTERVTRTEMVHKLINAGSNVFTVKFKKQMSGQDLQEFLEEEKYELTEPPAKKLKTCNKFFKDGGEDRTMVGYLINTEHELGRSNVHDLDATTIHKIRQVDHRTIFELILKRVKYELK